MTTTRQRPRQARLLRPLRCRHPGEPRSDLAEYREHAMRNSPHWAIRGDILDISQKRARARIRARARKKIVQTGNKSALAAEYREEAENQKGAEDVHSRETRRVQAIH